MADPTISIGKGGGISPVESGLKEKGLPTGEPSTGDVSKFQEAFSGAAPTGTSGIATEGAGVPSTSMGDQVMQGMQGGVPSTPTAPGELTTTSSLQTGGPFSLQFNSIATESTTEPSSLGGKIAEGTKSLIETGMNQEEIIKQEVTSAAQSGDLSPGKALELQFEVGNFTVMTDIVSKGANKVVQSVQTVVKNQ